MCKLDPISLAKAYKYLCITFLFGQLFGTLKVKSEPAIGSDFYSSGEGIQIAGDFVRVAYAVGTTQSLSFDGKWIATICDKGVQVLTDVDPIKMETSFIGEDQIQLETISNSVQLASISSKKAHKENIGSNMIYVQYLSLIIKNEEQMSNDTNYAKSWFHIATTLKADITNGVKCYRVLTNGTIIDRWYVTKYIEKRTTNDLSGGKIPWPGYATNGFLAIEVSFRPGKQASGGEMKVSEFWPKSFPTSSNDVDDFRSTDFRIGGIKKVNDINLLPSVTYKDTRVEDYRFMDSSRNLPLNLPLKPLGWVLSGSAQWSKFVNEVGLLKANRVGYGENTIEQNRHIVVRVVIFAAMLISFLALLFVIFRSVKLKHKNK